MLGRWCTLLWVAPACPLALEVSKGWSEILTEVRQEQAVFWKEAETWVSESQPFNAAWASEIAALEKEAQEAVLASQAEIKGFKKQMHDKCPVSCQTDPIQKMTWEGTSERAHLFAQETESKRKEADFNAELTEAKTLADRFDPFVKKTNMLHFKAKEEFEKFETCLAEKITPKTKESSLLRTRSARALVKEHDRVTLKRSTKLQAWMQALGGRGKPSKSKLDEIIRLETHRTTMTKAACAAMETAYTDITAIRQRINQRKAQAVSKHKSTIERYNAKSKKATEDAKKFSDVSGKFAAICEKEKQSYAARSETLGDLSPPELADEFEKELDRHHEWWSWWCGDMKTTSDMVHSWIAVCQKAWQSGVLGAEERILDVEGSGNGASAEEFKAATEGFCKSQDQFDEDLRELAAKQKGIDEFCGGGNCA